LNEGDFVLLHFFGERAKVRSGASSLYLFLLCFELPSLLRASSSSSSSSSASPAKFSLYLALQDQRLGFFRVNIL
jgi:hypothetical protein